MFNPEKTAIILVGYQNDYFGEAGLLRQVVEESVKANHVLENTLDLLAKLPPSACVVATPIIFTKTYEELDNPVGILKQIRDMKAFKEGTPGVEMVDALRPFSNRIIEIRGKRGFNAFAYTHLHQFLQSRGIQDIVITGAISSICVDSTGRQAHELGYEVTILSDCTAGRTTFEQDFYCENIFPVYANVMTHHKLINQLGSIAA